DTAQHRVAVLFNDISQRKQAEQALQEADRHKDEFLATLAHELRNPLAPLRNGLQIMRLSKGNTKVAERFLDMMERQVGQIVSMVDELLDVSRIRRGHIGMDRQR